MLMVRIDCMIFGYRKIKIEPSDLSAVTSVMLHNKIPTYFNFDGTFSVRERDFPKVFELLEGRFSYEASDTRGAYGAYKSFKHKAAAVIAILISVLIVFISSLLVWDVRIEGNEAVTDTAIVCGLSDCGFSVGKFWHRIDNSIVEAEFLSRFPEVSWININRRGGVAYVSVIENNAEEEKETGEEYKYLNIVADCDCVIEEITVKSGQAMVKPGDTVKRGDLLISGVAQTEFGLQLCRAEGNVIGRIKEKISAEVDRECVIKTKKNEKISSVVLKIFDFPVKILKKYGNSMDKYDIIKSVKTFSLFDKCKLPLELSTEYRVEYGTEVKIYSDDELIRAALYALNAKTAERLNFSDLIKIKTNGNFTETGYIIYSDVVYCTEVGKISPFYIQ